MLGFAVCLSTSGVVVSKHYCKNHLKDRSLYAMAKPCHSGSACPMHPNSGKSESKGCCDDRLDFLKSDQDKVSQSNDFDQEVAQQWAPVPEIALATAHISWDRKSLKFFNHKPPLISIDPAPLLQVFRC